MVTFFKFKSKTASAPKAKDPINAGPSGCLIIIVALTAMLGGLYYGARNGLPWEDAAPAAQHVPGDTSGASTEEKKLWTCSMHPQVIQDHPGICPICHMELVPLGATGEADSGHSGAVQIDPSVVQNMGVRTSHVIRGPVNHEIRATGYFEEVQFNVHEVNLRVSGWIDKLHANYDGVFVREGDPLFDLYSPEINQAAGELINASKSTNGHMASLGDAARHKLELWGLGKGQIDSIAKMNSAPRTVTFYSAALGHVLDKHVVEGAGVMAGQKLFDIVDHSQLWMDITLYENDLEYVEIGDPISVMTEAQKDTPLVGVIDFIYPHVDMMTRAAKARLLIENPDMTYRPGMFATAILTKELSADAFLVPREAIIDTGVRQIVFIALGDGHFEPREVNVGAEAANGEVEIISGLEQHEEVVTSGQFLLDNESRLKEAVQKYLRQSAGETTDETELDAKPEIALSDVATEAIPQSTANTNSVFSSYLDLAESLGIQESEKPETDAGPLLESVKELLKSDLDESVKAFSEALVKSIEDLANAAPEAKREKFKAISAVMIQLARTAPPSKETVETLYEVYCPMADASWLQRNDAVSNPYYSDMKTCGEVKSAISTAEAAP